MSEPASEQFNAASFHVGDERSEEGVSELASEQFNAASFHVGDERSEEDA